MRSIQAYYSSCKLKTQLKTSKFCDESNYTSAKLNTVAQADPNFAKMSAAFGNSTKTELSGSVYNSV